MIDDKCIRCGLTPEEFTLYRGWRLCDSHDHPSCYTIASGILKGAETYRRDLDMADLQERLEECWALLQVHSPGYLRTGITNELAAMRAGEEQP